MSPEYVGLAIGAGLAILGTIAAWVSARAYGLSTLQRAAKTETDRLTAAMRGRMDVLKTDLAAEKMRTSALAAENVTLKMRVSALEAALADRMIARNRHSAQD